MVEAMTGLRSRGKDEPTDTQVMDHSYSTVAEITASSQILATDHS